MISKIFHLAGVFMLTLVLAAELTVSPSQAAKLADWGAVYYEWPTGRYGWAWGYATEAEAKRAALAHGRTRGMNTSRHRHRWWTVRNGCIFVYKAVNGTRFGWGRSSRKRNAERKARGACQRGGFHCRMRVWICTRR